jgi:hypothetical protein
LCGYDNGALGMVTISRGGAIYQFQMQFKIMFNPITILHEFGKE